MKFLRRNEINLSTLCLASRILTPENADRVLSEIRNKSQREVEALVSRYEPASAIRDGARMLSVPVRVALPALETRRNHSRSGSDSQNLFPKSAGTTPDSFQDSKHARPEAASEAEAAVVQRFAVQFGASSEFMAKFEEARALLSNRPGGSLSFESIFEAGLDAFHGGGARLWTGRNPPISSPGHRHIRSGRNSCAFVRRI